MKLVWPVAVDVLRPTITASRPHDLRGLTAGFLDNTKQHLDVMFGVFSDRLKLDHGISQSLFTVKPTRARGMEPRNLDVMAKAHFVITGIGD